MTEKVYGQLRNIDKVAKDIIEVAIETIAHEVSNYNKTLRTSKTWKEREAAINEENLALIFINSKIQEAEIILAEYDENSDEANALNNIISTLKDSKENIIDELLPKEFGIINFSRWGYDKSSRVAWVSTQSLSKSSDELIEELVERIKLEQEIYI